jgi:hypothetical protein
VERGGGLEGAQGGENFVGDAEGPAKARAGVDRFEADGIEPGGQAAGDDFTESLTIGGGAGEPLELAAVEDRARRKLEELILQRGRSQVRDQEALDRRCCQAYLPLIAARIFASMSAAGAW